MTGKAENRDDPRPCFQPGRLWSLWDMVQKFSAYALVRLGVLLRELNIGAVLAEHEVTTPSAEDDKATRQRFAEFSKFSTDLEMPVSEELCKAAAQDPPKSAREFQTLQRAIIAEMKKRSFLYLPHGRAAFYENERTLTDEAKEKFPTAYSELREAGSCYATGRNTGCVLHCMRAAEVGVKAMSRALGHNPPDLEQQDWHTVLNKCESILEDMRNKMKKGPEKEAELVFYSQAAMQFRHFKDGWRVQAAHARPPFMEGEAKQILDATVSFYESLATRLSEDALAIGPERSAP